MMDNPSCSGHDNADIGEDTVIEEGVRLGLRYHPECGKAKIGAHSILRSGTIIYADVTAGDYLQTGHYAVIRARVEMGDHYAIGNHSALEGLVRMGSGVRIMSHVYIPSRTCIGDRVFIGPGTVFLNDKTPARTVPMPTPLGPFIEDDVMIGGGCVILPGVRIGERSFIAAGTVVAKDVPPGSFVMGVPGRCQPLPEGLDRGNNPDMMYAKLDLWHPQGAHPRTAVWQDFLGRAPAADD